MGQQNHHALASTTRLHRRLPGHLVDVTDTSDDDWEAVAKSAGLRYTSDTEPGIARRRCGRGFTYRADVGSGPDDSTRLRIDGLAIPPAWRSVWISTDPESHLQATGLDDRDRKQYLYHERWREVRDETKFVRLIEFADALPEIRKHVAADLATRRLTRTRSIAAVVRLLDTSLMRVGTERYAAENETFGATTLESRHVSRVDQTFRLDFVGKGAIEHSVEVDDSELSAVISESLALDQPRLFCFASDDGALYDINSGHVNDYLADIAGSGATAKTFRTWGATAIAVRSLATARSDTAPEQEFLTAVDAAAEALGNTRAVCRNCYVAPAIAAAAESGALADAWASSRRGRWRDRAENTTAKLL